MRSLRQLWSSAARPLALAEILDSPPMIGWPADSEFKHVQASDCEREFGFESLFDLVMQTTTHGSFLRERRDRYPGFTRAPFPQWLRSQSARIPCQALANAGASDSWYFRDLNSTSIRTRFS
jgi:hypothetical protein